MKSLNKFLKVWLLLVAYRAEPSAQAVIAEEGGRSKASSAVLLVYINPTIAANVS